MFYKNDNNVAFQSVYKLKIFEKYFKKYLNYHQTSLFLDYYHQQNK